MNHHDVEQRLFAAGEAARDLPFADERSAASTFPADTGHRLWPVGAGLLVAAAVAIVIVAIKSGSSQDDRRTPAAGQGTSTTSTSDAPAPTSGRSASSSSPSLTERPTLPRVDLNHLRTVPPNPVQGVKYPFDLYTHCGVDLTQFAGRTWRATTPVSNGLPGYVAGTVELLAPDRAQFVPAAGRDTGNVGVIDFVRTTGEVQPCL